MDKTAAIYIGMATCGLASGARKIYDETFRLVNSQGYPAVIHSTGCVGMCHNEPLLEIQIEGRPRVTYRQVTVESVASILKAHFEDHTVFPDLVFGQSGDNSENSYEAVPEFNDTD
ncbi:MAG: (2Fe-2S) ferredoxin domain-containing protein, partial [Nitrospirota bacterium]|nr:(2Fe-2S) ferredoxin domain-containing protein [Nitrospirota bacterium]